MACIHVGTMYFLLCGLLAQLNGMRIWEYLLHHRIETDCTIISTTKCIVQIHVNGVVRSNGLHSMCVCQTVCMPTYNAGV